MKRLFGIVAIAAVIGGSAVAPAFGQERGRPDAPAEGMMGRMGEMMGGRFLSDAWRKPDNQTPLTLDQAVEAARRSLVAYGNPDLQMTEVMAFTNNFYVEVEEKSTGIHAFELLVDRYTGAAYPEPGPNMMWNTQYGHMGSMMGGGWGQAPDTISVTSEQARDLAQKWLDEYLPGTAAAEQADAFYGYYTIHVLKDGQVFGMLSVNGYTGETAGQYPKSVWKILFLILAIVIVVLLVLYSQ